MAIATPQSVADLLREDRHRNPPIYELFSKSATDVSTTIEQIRQTINRSMYWIIGQRFADATLELHQLGGIPAGWDTYGAEAPSAESLALAFQILALMRDATLPPTRVAPSAEGGVGICFIEGVNYADIEVFNDKEILVTTYRGDSEPRIWQVENNERSISEALTNIRVHLAS